jgi:hypothetical protein
MVRKKVFFVQCPVAASYLSPGRALLTTARGPSSSVISRAIRNLGGGARGHMSHMVMLGDSIFDNAANMAGGPDVRLLGCRTIGDEQTAAWRDLSQILSDDAKRSMGLEIMRPRSRTVRPQWDLTKKAQGCLAVPLRGEEEVDDLAGLIHRALQVAPLPAHLDGTPPIPVPSQAGGELSPTDARAGTAHAPVQVAGVGATLPRNLWSH